MVTLYGQNCTKARIVIPIDWHKSSKYMYFLSIQHMNDAEEEKLECDFISSIQIVLKLQFIFKILNELQ